LNNKEISNIDKEGELLIEEGKTTVIRRNADIS